MAQKKTGLAARLAFVASIPVLTGYLMLGIGFGILLASKGFGAPWSLAMGALIYAGSMQFVAVDLLAGGASLLNTAAMTLMVNARHLFYGVSMIEKYRGAGKKKLYLIFGLTDETYSLLCNGTLPEGVDLHTYQLFVTLFDHCYWTLGCLLGGVIGSVLPFALPGVEFVLTALFVSIFVEQWLSTKDHVPALIGLVCTLVCLLIFGKQSFLLPAMLLIVLGLAALKLLRKGEKKNAG